MSAIDSGSTVKASLLMALESAVNNSLAYDPATQQSLLALDGKVLHLACTMPAQSVYVLFVGNHVELWSLFESAALFFFNLITEAAKILEISSASFKILLNSSSFLSKPSLNKQIQYFDSFHDFKAIP